MHAEEILQNIEDKKLEKLFKLISNIKLNYSIDREIFPKRIDYIIQIQKPEVLEIEKIISETGLELHELDTLIPLLYSYSKIYDIKSFSHEFVEGFNKYLERLNQWMKLEKKLFYEDSIKKKILLVLPSEKHFSRVRDNWDYWLWKRETVYGEITPTFHGWMEDIIKIADALKSEDIDVIIAVDSDGYEELRSIYEGSIIEVDIPEDLPKMGYVRDQSVTWFKEPIIGSMALHLRRGEEDMITKIYREIGLEPIYRVGLEVIQDRVELSYLEGGNFIFIEGEDKHVLFTGVGVRGSNMATFKSLSRILPENVKLIGVPISGYLRRWEYGAVHLDVVMMYPGELDEGRIVFIDPSRMGLYSFLEYDRDNELFRVRNGFEVFKELDVKVDEPPSDGASRITMVNALNLGGGKLMVDSYNKRINRYLESYGAEVIEVDIPHIEAGGGGIRCASREIWI